MEVHVNYLAVLAAAVASYIIGAIWYGAIFSKVWVRLTGITDMKPAPVNMVLVLISSFVMAFVLDHTIAEADYFHKVSGVESGLVCTFFTWLGFVVPVMLCTKLYEKKPWALWFMDIGFWLLSMFAMGAILSVWT